MSIIKQMSFIINQHTDYKKLCESLMTQYYHLYDYKLQDLGKVYTYGAKITFDNLEFNGFNNLYNYFYSIGTFCFSRHTVVCTPQLVGNDILISCTGNLTINNFITRTYHQTLLFTCINGAWYVTNDITTF